MLAAGVLGCQRLARLLPGGKVELARREVPGAAFQFPVGKVKDEKLDYEEGKVGVEVARGSLAQIEWNTGEMLVGPVRESLRLSVVEHADVLVGGGAGQRWLLRGNGIEMSLAVWSCGKRFFTLTHASGQSTTALERSILGSFVCKPDPARDGRLPVVGVELDLAPDFGMTEENPLTVVSLDDEGLVISPYTGNEAPDDPKYDELMPRFLSGVATTAGASGASFRVTTLQRGGATRKLWRGAGEMNGQRIRLLATALRCGSEIYLAIYMGPDAKPEAGALDLLLRPRCSKSPKRPPPFAEVARKACARGDKRGCE